MLIACAAPGDAAFWVKAPGKTKLAAMTAITTDATAAPFQLRQKELDTFDLTCATQARPE